MKSLPASVFVLTLLFASVACKYLFGLSAAKSALKEKTNPINHERYRKYCCVMSKSLSRFNTLALEEDKPIDTLISEEALLFAKYLRNERKDWIPRTPTLQLFASKENLTNPIQET
jgi:hypothetical protein